nr:AzlC family ABC transporter permease [uncultured Gellertiella sp.]
MENNNLTERSGLFWFARGAARVTSIPSIILMFAFMGFAGLCRDSGFTLPQTLAMVASIWALPANVVLVGAILSKASLLTAMLSVGLSSIRLLPMAVAILPEMQVPKTRKLTLYVLSHFVAITAWVMALERFADIPKPHRTAYFGGIGFIFLVANLLVVMLTFAIANALPPLLAAALIFITPLYFLFSLWGSAREHHSHFAMGFGLLLTPVFHALSPQTDILLTGVTGGVLAYVTGQFVAGRAKR